MNALQRDLKKLVPLVESLGAEKAAADPHRQRFHLQPPTPTACASTAGSTTHSSSTAPST